MIPMPGPEEAIKAWFSSRGFRPSELSEWAGPGRGPDMVFEGDGGLAFVILLSGRAMGDRGAFMDAVMRASSLRPACNFLYLAVPRLAAPFVDTEVLKEHDIGLLVVDDDEVREALPSPFRPVARGRAEQAPAGPEIDELLKRLTTLENRLAALERELMGVRPLLNEMSSVKGLREQVKALSSRLNALSRRVDLLASSLAQRPAGPAVAKPVPSPAPTPAMGPGELEGLPSFFKDNPWLEILARRGQDELPA